MMLSQLQESQAPWNMPRELEDTPEMVCVLKNLADNDYKVVELAEYLEYPREGEEDPDYYGWVQHAIMEASVYENCYN
jgi:hypothetical protein